MRGSVQDAMGPVIGASVVEKGTKNATVTDLDGNFSINVKPGATLVISYLGYKTQEIAVGNQSTLSVTMAEEDNSLDEVVVVGYGVQKKKLVTGATVQVKGEELAKLNTTSAFTALQSKTPGVQITQSNGQAGDGFKVYIRGIGTTGNSAPLYVIDGVAGGDLNSLNPSDIETIDVLKDAASAAIYGARAANGVILVTTKQGKAGKMQISYDGYVGFQYLAKKFDSLNAQEWMYAQELKEINGGNSAPDWSSSLPADLLESVQNGTWSGTDWIDESYHKGALTTNHAINLVGGNDMSKVSMGFSYTSQDGIFGGETQSGYERYTARINSDHVLLKGKGFDIIKIGENFTWNHTGKNGISQGNMYWNNIHDLLLANPLLPAYTSDGGYYDNNAITTNGWGLGSTTNPLYLAATTSQGLNESKTWNTNLSAYLEVQPIKNLVWRSQFSYKQGNSTYRSMTKAHSTGTDVSSTQSASQSMSTWSSIAFDNTISYKRSFKEHNFDAVLGQSIEKNSYGMNLDASSQEQPLLR